jgi:hypothetical protein
MKKIYPESKAELKKRKGQSRKDYETLRDLHAPLHRKYWKEKQAREKKERELKK